MLTNIGVSHLEKLGTRENILAEKLSITRGLQGVRTLVLNEDNDLLSTCLLYTSKPITATPEELAENPRSHSAKLRVIEKLPEAGGPIPTERG